ncbi:unnamed protein product, partial [Symbiodinium necroappetens]
WKLFPPPLTLFTAPVLLGWRHLPQADSFFWRKDVEDHALARYTTDATTAVDPGEAMDAATMSSESFEEVLIEEPDIEQPVAPAEGYEAEEEMSGMSGPAANAPLAEEEMPIYIQAGDVRLSSHDYHDDDYPTRPATAKRHRSRSRHRSSMKHHAATDVATPAEPASSSHGAFPPEPPVPEPSVASVASDAAVKTATATTSAWTIPQWARKAINKRLKERRARVPSEEPPPRPRGKSIWFMSEDEAEDAGLVQQGRSSVKSGLDFTGPLPTSGVPDTVDSQQHRAAEEVAPPDPNHQTAVAGPGGPGSGSSGGLEGLENIYHSGAEEGSDDDDDSFHREVAGLPPLEDPPAAARAVADRDGAPRGGNTRRGLPAPPPSAHRNAAVPTETADTIPSPTSLYPPTLSWADLGSENFHAFCDLPMGLVLRAAATHLFSTGRRQKMLHYGILPTCLPRWAWCRLPVSGFCVAYPVGVISTRLIRPSVTETSYYCCVSPETPSPTLSSSIYVE